MRVRPTELGVKGMLLLAALELAFLATSYSNLFFLLIAFCCVLGALCLWWSLTNLHRVRVCLHEPPFAAAGSRRTLRLDVDAARRTRFDLTIEIRVQGVWLEIAHLPLATGSVRIEASLAGLPRGVHDVQGLRTATHFPFGFFRSSRVHPVVAALVTHPDPAAADLDARSPDNNMAQLMANHGQRSPAVAGLRPFRTGDTLADVHWKASARRGTAIVKEREIESGSTVEVVIDRRCDANELESALAMATGLVFLTRQQDRALRLRSQDCALEVCPSDTSERAALRWLASATCLPATAAAPPAGAAGSLRVPMPSRAKASHG